MLNLIKPPRLKIGGRVATVSLSWGGAGNENLLWRYNVGKRRLQEEFGLEVVEMPNTLKGSDYIYAHPEARARDLMDAFTDTSIKAVFSCIGGDDSLRMLPYIDFDVIRRNPKIFIGYSDTTVTHFICLKAGLTSFCGPSILAELAENIEIFPYTKHFLQKTLFEASAPGEIPPPDEWTSERIEWLEENRDKRKTMHKHTGFELLQGRGVVRGRLIGGCMEVLEMIKSTVIWPSADAFKDAILFFETSEDMPEPDYIKYWLRNYGAQGILQNAAGIAFGKPYNNKYYDEYKAMIKKVVADELGLSELPVLCNLSFGHTEPMCCLPYGALAEIDCERKSFSILEPGVV